jgi:hypothetical protein
MTTETNTITTEAPAANTAGDSITVLKSIGPLLTKRWNADGTLAPYDDAKHFTYEERGVGDIRELSKLLKELEREPQRCIIRGRCVSRGKKLLRRNVNFADQPLHAMMVDVDGFESLAYDEKHEPVKAIEEFILTKLPAEFRGVSYHWQLSSSFGRSDKPGLRAHLWFWLAEPRTSADMRAWAEHNKDKHGLDPAVYRQVQVHYTAAPVFDPNVADPVAERSGFAPGFRDAVSVNITVQPAPRERARSSGKPHALTEDDVRELLSHVRPNAEGERDYWLKVLWALRRAFLQAESFTDEAAWLALVDEWSARGAGYDGIDVVDAKWVEADDRPEGPNIGYLWNAAKAGGWSPSDERKARLHCSQDVADRAAMDDLSSAGLPPVVEEIRLEPGEFHTHAAACERLLANELYARERQLVRIGGATEATEQGDIRRDAAQAVIINATTQWLRRRLNALAKFKTWRRREKEWVTVNCPRDLAENIAGQGDWPTLNTLETIARAPFLRADGSICETPGYDRSSRVYYAPNAEFPPVPTGPTRADAGRALADLLKPFDEFPFATEEARSAFAAAILTEAVRSAIGTSPAFFYTAPTAGTGKSLLSEMPSRIVHGTAPAMRPWAADDELRKTLFASLLVGDRSIGFDNLTDGSKVRSSVLCAFLTAPTYADRKLGVSEAPSLPNRSVVFATGNNLTPAGDLSRRSIVIRLDANLEAVALRLRSFKVNDLRTHVNGNRPELLTAVLTILAAHRVAGHPAASVSLPSFERWSGLVRDPLVWLGMADPVGTQLQESDDDAMARGEAFRLLHARAESMQKPTFEAADVADWCAACIGNDDLAAAIKGTGECSDPGDPAKVRYWLRGNRDRVAGGFKLEFLKKSVWRVSTLGELGQDR